MTIPRSPLLVRSGKLLLVVSRVTVPAVFSEGLDISLVCMRRSFMTHFMRLYPFRNC